jgi:hypothetical protein
MPLKDKDFDKMSEAIDAVVIVMRKNTKKTLKEMAKLVEKEVKKNTSIADEHTPAWLKSQGHPYSRKKNQPPHKEPLVHKVSGTLTNNVEIFKGDRRDELQVGVSEQNVPYVSAVVFGTKKMIARDFLSFSLLSVQKDLRKLVVKNFKQTLKSKRKIRDIGLSRK